MEEDFSVEGPLVVLWDEQAGPIWDATGLLPDEPEWLKRALNLTDALIAGLLTWMSDMTAVHDALHDGASAEDWRQRLQNLNERGQEIANRLQAEVGDQYTVSYPA